VVSPEGGLYGLPGENASMILPNVLAADAARPNLFTISTSIAYFAFGVDKLCDF